MRDPRLHPLVRNCDLVSSFPPLQGATCRRRQREKESEQEAKLLLVLARLLNGEVGEVTLQ